MDHRRGAGARRGTWPRRPGPARPTGGAPGPAGAFEYAPLTTLEIYRAVPQGSRRAHGQREWLDRLARDLELAGLQARTQRNVLAVARVLMRRASWKLRTTMPVIWCGCCRAGGDCREQDDRLWCLVRAASVSVSTWKRIRRWLEGHGYLGTVRPGRTPMSQHIGLDEGTAPNEAAVYVPCVPRPRPRPSDQGQGITAGQPRTGPLTLNRRLRVLSPARELPRTAAHDDGTPAFVVAYLRSQVAELRRGPGKTITDRAVLAVARPFLAERWSPADLAKAIGHDPVTGRQHRTSLRSVRQPASWLAWRLSRWCADPEQAWKSWHTCGRWDHDAWPVVGPSPSELVTAAAAADRAAAAAVIDRRPGADPRAFADKIRQQLGWRTSPRQESHA